METGIKVGDCMKTSLVCVSVESSVMDAAKKMAEAGVGSLLVTNNKGICGIVTEHDLVEKVLSKGLFDSRVGDICSKELITISINEDISKAAKLMGEKHVKRLVATSSASIVGIISQRDLISIAPSLYDVITAAPHPVLKVY
ncbi:CBS domain-containing protein [Candidatus Micrarchaeota archaeon]|nr:CBS domain-containing protein [Candidatus Micrarchaeota archaeon]